MLYCTCDVVDDTVKYIVSEETLGFISVNICVGSTKYYQETSVLDNK